MRLLRPLVLLLLFGWLLARSGRFLVVDQPRRADVILVLAGETDRRPTRALDLLAGGYSQRVILDVPAGASVYGQTQAQLAQAWVGSLPQKDVLSVCMIQGLSTKAEARDAAACLDHSGARSVLLVTSDFHTRRALNVFRRELPHQVFSVAAAYDSIQFGTSWWQHRQWAKTYLDEWERLVWWQVADRWF